MVKKKETKKETQSKTGRVLARLARAERLIESTVRTAARIPAGERAQYQDSIKRELKVVVKLCEMAEYLIEERYNRKEAKKESLTDTVRKELSQ